MQITINGKQEIVPERTTVAGLLERHGLAGAACAVEINRGIVPKKQHGSRELQDGDTIEIVTLVGGG
jgi:sulfur carrier protein